MLYGPLGLWAATGLQLYLAASGIRKSPSSTNVITHELSHFVQEVLNSSTIPGLSLGVVRLADDKTPVVEFAAWGRQTEESAENDLTPDALFALASCSKAFLVTSVGLLMEDYAQGRNMTPLPSAVQAFNWETKLKDILPGEWIIQDRWTESKANLRDAFSHLTGMPRHDYSYRPGDTAAYVVRRMRHLPPAYELREQWSYNNQMFMLGAHIVAKYANMSYGSFVAERIFKPLNMTSTSFSPSEAAKTGRLTQTWTRGVRRVPFWMSDAEDDLFAGAGGAISNVEDMTKWLATLLNGGVNPITNRTIVPASVLTDMTTARAIVHGEAEKDISVVGYGMGWFRMSYKGHDVVWHPGAIPGFSLLVAFLPADHLGAVILANMDDKAEETMSVLQRVIDIALGLPATPPPVENHRTDDSETEKPQEQNAVPADDAKPLPLDLDAYTGHYTNVGYGDITLCSPNSTSSYCAHVLADFAAVDAASGEQHPETRLLAAWPRLWSTHIRMLHIGGNSFRLIFPALFPQGYGWNKTAFEYYDSAVSMGRVEFVVEDGQVRGFAMVTDEVVAEARAQRTSGSIREIGDAWFVRTR
ncbi:beta-lactamase/transpeptidase-like protein [Cubamyces lactineus]|nr:beta-lactamase/transpeptidase-like protein [Cubamyces lactineus]